MPWGDTTMSDSQSAIVTVLEPHMGTAIANAFVITTALSLHKDVSALGPEDYPTIEGSLRSMLASVSSPQLVEKALTDVREALALAR